MILFFRRSRALHKRPPDKYFLLFCVSGGQSCTKYFLESPPLTKIEKEICSGNLLILLWVPSLWFPSAGLFFHCHLFSGWPALETKENPKGIQVQGLVLTFDSLGSVCKVRTQDPENLDEEVKSLVTAWRLQEIPQCQALPKTSRLCLATSSSTSSPSQGPLFSLWVLPWVQPPCQELQQKHGGDPQDPWRENP